MTQKLTVDPDILFFAFRYALPRMTYAPNVVMASIKKNIDKLDTAELERYIKEIDEFRNFGMEMDEVYWQSFKAYLEGEIAKRRGA